MSYYFYYAFMIISLIVSLFVIVLSWRYRSSTGAQALLALAAATFVWTLGFLLQANSDTLERQTFFSNIGYLGGVSAPVAWFIFSLRYTNTGSSICGWKMALLLVIPVIAVVLIWTNDWHSLMWSNAHLAAYGDFLVTEKTFGALSPVVVAYCYLLVLAGAVVMLRRLFVGIPLYVGQAISLLIAVTLPVVGNVLYILHVCDVLPTPQVNLTPLMFAISGIAITLGLVRFRLLTTMPFAHEFVMQQLSDGVLVFDSDNKLVEANSAAVSILTADESLIGKNLVDLLPFSPVFEYLSPTDFRQIELQLKISGKDRYFELETVPMVDKRRDQVGWLAIIHDISERKKAEEQYRLVTENSADVIYKLSIKDERYTYVSPSVKRLLGYTDEEALALTPRMILTAESYEHQISELMKDMKSGTIHRTLQLDAIHKEGYIVPIEVHGGFVYDENGEPVEIVGVARDITERKKMGEQIIMQDRLASIGQLTSGVAHELSNPLTSILSFSSFLLQKDLPDDVKQDLQTINDEAERIALMAKNLLAFARKQPREKQLLNINEGIKQVLELRAYEQKVNNIRVESILAADLPEIMANGPQLQQVFFNIIINAEFFMVKAHGKGVLTIKTEKAGDYVRASFNDDGPGISVTDQKQLFTPFFTTKEQGQGTGLSLSICMGIITEHGGRIWAESEPGKGSTFILELPVYHNDDDNNDESPE
jgi:PAS domain S-box-containing protein